MTVGNSPRCIANTLVYEGAYGKTSADRGDWTSGKIGVGRLAGTAYGIAAMTLVERGLPEDYDLRTLTEDHAIELYRKKEWQEVAGDLMPMGLDQIIYDGTVNSGKGRGVPWVGKAVKCPTPTNAKAVAQSANLLSFDQRRLAVKAASASRVAFLHSLAIFSTFGVGWMRRCTGMEAIGVKMVLEDSKMTAPQIHAELSKEAGVAQAKVKTASTTAATATAGSGAGASQATDPTAWEWSTIFTIGGFTLAVIGVMVWLIFIAMKNYQKNSAYLAVAEGHVGG